MAQRRLVEIVLQGKDQTKSAFDSLGLSLGKSQTKLLAFAGASAAVAAAAVKAVDALYDFTAAQAALGDEFDKMSARTGVVVEELSALDFAVRRGGGTTADMETAVRRLAKAMGDTRDGIKEYSSAFAQLGISAADLVDANGSLKSVSDVLPLIADGLQQIDSQAARMDIAQTILGRGGTRLLPALQEGRDGLRELREEMERYGGAMTTEFSTASASFVDSATNLENATQRLKEAVSEPFLVPFTNAVNTLAEAVGGLSNAAPGGLGNVLSMNATPGLQGLGSFWTMMNLQPGGGDRSSVIGNAPFEQFSLLTGDGAPRGPVVRIAPESITDMASTLQMLEVDRALVPIPGQDDLMRGFNSGSFGPDFSGLRDDMFVGLDDASEQMSQLGLTFTEVNAQAESFGNTFGSAIGVGLARALTSAENFGDAFTAILNSLFESALGSVGSSIFGSIFGALSPVPGAGAVGGVASAGTKAAPSPVVLAGSGAMVNSAMSANGRLYV